MITDAILTDIVNWFLVAEFTALGALLARETWLSARRDQIYDVTWGAFSVYTFLVALQYLLLQTGVINHDWARWMSKIPLKQSIATVAVIALVTSSRERRLER